MTVNGQMQARCWKGQRPFDWEDIFFEHEIIADDNTLNFYVPIFFDAYGIFGEEVSNLEPDDSYNVYANYNLDEGEISDYLEITVEVYGFWESPRAATCFRIATLAFTPHNL